MRESEDNYSHILKYTGIFGGVQGLIILIGLVRNKAMALLLGVGGMGFNSLLTSMQEFASRSTNLGISFGAVPRLSELYEQDDAQRLDYYISVIRLWSMIAAMLGLLFCVVVSPLMNELSFSWGDHTLHYAMLGLSVAMMALTAGELAILKSTRRLGSLARSQIYAVVANVVITVPIYYFYYHSGVVPALVLMSAVNLLVTASYSYRYYPPKLNFSRKMLHDGTKMIRLGMATVLAAAIGSGVEMAVRSYLNVAGGMDEVGLYNAAYMITITYAGMVFTSMEADYFPRLSAVSKDIQATNNMVNRQMEVSLLMLSPMLAGLLMMLPVLVPLFFSSEFLPVVGIAQIAVLAMYFKVLTMPVAYITLARGYSLSFLFLETSYYVALIIAIVVGFSLWGIYGTSIAIVVAHIFEYLLINGYAYLKYGYRCTRVIGRYASIQMAIGALSFSVSVMLSGWAYWITEAALALASTAYSVHILRQKTHLWESLKRKFRI